MTAKVIRPAISLGALSMALVAILAVYFAFGSGSASAGMTYNATTYVHHCNSLDPSFINPALAGSAPVPVTFKPTCTETLGASANPIITTILDEKVPDSNFSNVVTFLPNSYTLNSPGTIPTGTLMGGLRSNTNLGLVNGACNNGLNVEFELFNVALPNNGDPTLATNIAWPSPEGTSNRFFTWYVGNGAGKSLSGTPSTISGGAVTVDGLRATASAAPIANYPGYLLNLFDPDFVPGVVTHVPPADASGAGFTTSNSIIPLAVYGGVTNVANTWVPLFFAQFASGGLVPMGGVSAGFVAAMGQPSQSVLNDPTAIAASPSSITDFCTPLTVTTALLGDPAGAGVRVTSPAAVGTAFHLQYAASLRDTDQDGHENALDPCQLVVNAGTPRVAGSGDGEAGVPPGDGILDECDPTPATDTAGFCDIDGPGGLPGSANAGDHDGDCFKNRQDNCPTVANATVIAGGPGHLDSDITSTPADLGPAADGIGDVCDSGTISVTQNNISFSLTLSSTVSNGRYLSVTNVIAKCIVGGAQNDFDGDGYCTDREGGQDGTAPGVGQCGANAGPSACPTRHQNWTAVGHPLLTATLDSDSDGWTDIRETQLGRNILCVSKANPGLSPSGNLDGACLGTETVPLVDPVKGCAHNTGLNGEFPHDNWPLDFNDNGGANSSDALTYIPRLNDFVDHLAIAPSGTQGDERWDLDHNGIINTAEILAFYVTIPNLNKSCATALPVAVPAWSQQ